MSIEHGREVRAGLESFFHIDNGHVPRVKDIDESVRVCDEHDSSETADGEHLNWTANN